MLLLLQTTNTLTLSTAMTTLDNSQAGGAGAGVAVAAGAGVSPTPRAATTMGATTSEPLSLALSSATNPSMDLDTPTNEPQQTTLSEPLKPLDTEVTTLEEARQVIAQLRAKYRAQSHQLMAWRRRAKAQEELLLRHRQERHEQLKTLSAQLVLFESRLCRKQNEIETLLADRESIIVRQQRAIELLQSRLSDLMTTSNGDPCDNLDSLNDSDSAVVMEESDHDGRPRPVCRSVSDAFEPHHVYISRRSNGLLRRPDVLETVYSIEEDGSNEDSTTKLTELSGSFERLNEQPNEPPPTTTTDPPLTTYNRVMSNHRSVTKPKDVKYKRINKAKSKSLEELRGRLRNWVDKGGHKVTISLDQSYA